MLEMLDMSVKFISNYIKEKLPNIIKCDIIEKSIDEGEYR